jgi:hypothetical protein
MATTTPNYGLTKPATTDYYNISVPNANMDIIDTQMKTNATAISNHVASYTAHCLTATTTLYVATTGNDTTGDGSSSAPYATITHALSVLPNNLNGYIATINVAAGTYPEIVAINNFYGGGNIYINGATALTDSYIINNLKISHCSCYVCVTGFLCTSTTNIAVAVFNSYAVQLLYIKSIVSAASYDGINFSVSQGYCTDCMISNHSTGLTCNNSSIVSDSWTAGTGNTSGLYCYGGNIYKNGTQPEGTTAEVKVAGGQIN